MHQQSDQAWAKAVRDNEAIRYSSLLRADIATLDKLFGENLVYTHSSGVVDTKASYLEAIADGRLHYRDAAADIQQLFAVDDEGDGVVICISRIRMNVDVDGVAMRLVNQGTGVWARSEEGFKLVAFQATPVRQPDQ